MKYTFHISILLVCLLLASCTLTKRVKDGDTAFRLKQYAVAVDMLEEEYENARSVDDRLRKTLYLGESYDILQNQSASTKWYKKANTISSTIGVRTKLAEAYKKAEAYQDAYKIYQNLYQETRDLDWSRKAQFCKEAIKHKEKVSNYNLTSFSGNTSYNEYSPFYLDNDYIVFTSDRDESTGGDTYNWTGNSFSDIYVANIRGRKVNNFDAVLNSGANEGTACFSQDRNEIYFTRCESIDLRDQHCRIYYSQRPNGFWLEPEPLLFFGETTNFAHPCLIENDSVLIFSAAPVNSDGTYDLYYSERVKGGWSEPALMPPSINSPGNEMFPTADQDTLYFSSDYHQGYGGHDIFKTYLRNEESWAKPENMGIPINSGADDFGLAVDPTTRRNSEVILQGYLSSSRTQGMGDDIFFFTKYREVETEEPVVVEKSKGNNGQVYLSIRVVEVLYENDDPNGDIIGKNPLPGTELSLEVIGNTEVVSTDKNGRYITDAVTQARYQVIASKNDFLTNKITISTAVPPLLEKDTTINIEIPLEKIRFGAEIVLQSIYYDYERWNIRKDAKPSLDTLKTVSYTHLTLPTICSV